MSDAPPVLWTYPELCEALGVPPVERAGLPEVRVQIVTTFAFPAAAVDALYVPLTERRGQRSAVESALAYGAAAALTDVPLHEYAPDAPVIPVPDVRDAVVRLAAAGRARAADVVGITGSVGKSTVHAMTGLALEETCRFYSRFLLHGNVNVVSGLLPAIASTPPGTAAAAFEISSRGLGELAPAAALVKPTVAVVTAAAESHRERYADPLDIVTEKLSLLDHLTGRRAAVVSRAVLEMDRAHERLMERKPVDRLVSVGSSPDDTVRLCDVRVEAMRTAGVVEVEGVRCEIDIPAPGRHLMENALFALGVAASLGVEPRLAARGLARFAPLQRRGFRVFAALEDGGTAEIVDDSMNASPKSVRALLDALALRSPRRKILVLGDMLELGADAERLHRELAPDVRRAGLDLLVTVGSLARTVGEEVAGDLAVMAFAAAPQAAAAMPGIAEAGDLVAIKGSTGSRVGLVGLALATPARPPEPAGARAIEDEPAPGVPTPRPQPAARPPALWTYEELCRDLGVEPLRTDLAGAEFDRVATTLGRIGPRTLFASRAKAPDVREQVRQALEQGAVAALAPLSPEELAGAPIIEVRSGSTALAALGRSGRRRCRGPVVGIVESASAGALGEAIASALAPLRPHAGAQPGPLAMLETLANTPVDAPALVLRLPWTEATGTRWVRHARPDVVVFDEPDGDRSRLASLGANAVAVVPGTLRGTAARTVSVGTADDDDVRVVEVRSGPAWTHALVEVHGGRHLLRLGEGGHAAASAAALAVGAALAAGVEAAAAVAALNRSASPVQRARVDVRGSGRVTELVDDAYGPQGPSVVRLVEELRARPRAARRVLVLAETPQDDPEDPVPFGEHVRGAGIDLVISAGEAPADVPATVFAGIAEAAEALPALVRHGDLLAMWAPSGARLWPLVRALLGDATPQMVRGGVAPDLLFRVLREWRIEDE